MRGSPTAAAAAQRLSARFLGAAEFERARPAFRGNNRAVQTAADREIVLTGPGGTGKSVALLTRLHRNAEQYPGSRQLIIRKTRASLTESALATFEEKGVLPKDHPVLFNRDGQRIARKNRTSYDYPNGATIVVGGMDEATRLFSTDYDTVYWQECQEGRVEEWESLLRALRNPVLPVRQLLGDCNPSSPAHWLKLRSKAGRLQLWETYHKDNPFLWDEAAQDWTQIGREYVSGLESMTGVLRDRLFLGLWVAVQGAIYAPYFRRTGRAPNVVPRFEVPADWRLVLSIDFGFSHPFAAGLWAVDGDGRMFEEHEIHMAGRTLDEHAPAIKAMLRGRPYEGVADSASPEAIERLKALGIYCRPAAKGPDSVNAGIRQVIARLADPGDGRARLAVMEGALVERDEARAEKHMPLCLEDEIDLYRWKVDLAGNPKDEPVKEHDDGCDQTRYAVQFVDGQEGASGPPEIAALPRPARTRRVC